MRSPSAMGTCVGSPLAVDHCVGSPLARMSLRFFTTFCSTMYLGAMADSKIGTNSVDSMRMSLMMVLVVWQPFLLRTLGTKLSAPFDDLLLGLALLPRNGRAFAFGALPRAS